MANLNKRIQKAEQKTTPEGMPEIEIQLCDNRDHIDNPDRYEWTPVPDMSDERVTVQRPTPKN